MCRYDYRQCWLLTPSVNCIDEYARVKGAYAGNMQVFEGWNAAEGMLVGSAQGKVAVDGVVLLIRRPLDQGSDDMLDIVSWKAQAKIALGTTQGTALVLEIVHADGRQVGSGVVAGSEMVDLMDRDGGVDDFGLDDLLLDQRLDGLIDMTGRKY